MMDVREDVELDFGIRVGEAAHCRFVLRPATLKDTYRAAALVPVPENLGDDSAAKVAYQMAIDDALVLCQVETVGTLPEPPSLQVLLAGIDPDDMDRLRQAAAQLKKKWRESRKASPPIAAPSASSSPPASA